MAYRIDVSSEAELDLRALRTVEQRRVRAALPQYLAHTPGRASNARKLLDPNRLGVTWELRLGPLRVFYDLDEAAQCVRVERVGYKRGNELYLRNRRADMRSE